MIDGIPTTEAEFEADLVGENEKERRSDEIKKLWKGFEKFRNENPELEARFRLECDYYGLVAGRDSTIEEEGMATEVMMLFVYGIKLARELRPLLTSKTPVPNVKVEFSQVSFAARGIVDRVTGEIKESWIVAGNMKLLSHNDIYTTSTVPWKKEKTRSASEYLNDRAVVDVVIAGAEEYAHEILFRTKEGERVLALDKNASAIKSTRDDMVAAGEGYESSDVVYHSSDVERRGLVWQQAVLRKHLPSWAGPTDELVEKAKQLRMKFRTQPDG